MMKTTSPAPKKIENLEKGKGLSTVSIVRSDAIKQGLNPDQVVKALGTVVKDPHYQLVKFGHTVFLLHLIKPYTVELHIFTTDNVMGVMNALKQMIAMAKSQGIKKGYSYSDQQAFKEAVQRSGFPIKISQTVKKIGNQMKPVYQYEMDL